MDAALDDARGVIRMLTGLGVRARSASPAGTPYYNPHVQRPALFPPVDGYEPPEDPLRGVARQIDATARLKADFPELAFVGSAYSYLQEWLPQRRAARRPPRPDRLRRASGGSRSRIRSCPPTCSQGTPLRRKFICRTFSDCTTGPRMGLVSGCYPLDPHYAATPEAPRILAVRTAKAAEAGPQSRHHAHRRRESHHLLARPQLRDAQAGNRRRRLGPRRRHAERP